MFACVAVPWYGEVAIVLCSIVSEICIEVEKCSPKKRIHLLSPTHRVMEVENMTVSYSSSLHP